MPSETKTNIFFTSRRQPRCRQQRGCRSTAGLNQFKQECLAKEINLEQSLICCEHTGIYSQNILTLATENDSAAAAFLFGWTGSPERSSLRIKRSLGLQRGKSDKIDAIRISEYVPAGNRFRYADKATLWQPERQTISKLRQLVSLRKRLPQRRPLNAKNALKVPLDEAAAAL